MVKIGVKKHRTPTTKNGVLAHTKAKLSLGGHDVDRSKNTRKVHSSHDSADPKVRESQTRRSSAAAGFLGIGTFTPGNGHDSRVPAIGHLFK